MKNGNIPFYRRVSVFVLLLAFCVGFLTPINKVYASGSGVGVGTTYQYGYTSKSADGTLVNRKYNIEVTKLSGNGVYCIYERHLGERDIYNHIFYFVSNQTFTMSIKESYDEGNGAAYLTKDISVKKTKYDDGNYYFVGLYKPKNFSPIDNNIYFPAIPYLDIPVPNGSQNQQNSPWKDGVSSNGGSAVFLKYILAVLGGSYDGFTMSFDESDTTVNNGDIGYLKNPKLDFYTVYDRVTNQPHDRVYKLSWNKEKSTTDYDISKSKIQIMCKYSYFKDDTEQCSDFFPLGLVDASLGSVKFNQNDLFLKAPNCYNAYQSDNTLANLFKTGSFGQRFYLRFVDGDNLGPWVELHWNASLNDFTSTQHDYSVNSGTIDNNGNFTPDNNISDIGSGSHASGTTTEEAEDNLDVEIMKDNGELWNNLESFVSGIGNVPTIIRDLFSFLPSWCLTFVAISFALLVLLIVVKFIRG